MTNKVSNKSTANVHDRRIPANQFVDDSIVRIVGSVNYPNELLTPDKLNGMYEVSTYKYHDHTSRKRATCVTLVDISDGRREFCVSDGEYVTASVFTRVKPRNLRLNDDYDAEIFPGGHTRVGCQDISAKNAERAALAILKACGYTFS